MGRSTDYGGRRRAATVCLVAPVGAALGIVVLIYKSRVGGHPGVDLGFDAAGGYLFLIAGVIGGLRRPENRVGLMMVFVGVAWFAEDLMFVSVPLVSSLGNLLADASSAVLVHLVLLFPFGRFDSRFGRPLTAASYVIVFVIWPVVALLEPDHGSRNVLSISDDPALFSALSRMVDGLGALVAVSVVAVLIAQWAAAKRATRRVLAPVFVTGLIGGAATAAASLFVATSLPRQLLLYTFKTAFCLLPLMFLLGLLRVRLGRTAVGDLLVQLRRPLAPHDLRDLLARTLGDPAVQLAYWEPERATFVDATGQPVGVPHGPGYATTVVEHDGRMVAALTHDAGLNEDVHMLRPVVAALGLAIENGRLATEAQVQLARARESRARIVTAGDEARRRLERDLHDGTQQSLVVAALTLRMATKNLSGQSDPAALDLMVRAGELLDEALAELRRFASGVHPAVLTESGLGAALEALAARVPIPVRLSIQPMPRLAPQIEATAYFTAAEAVTNALKHAQATSVRIGAAMIGDGSALRVEVADDGIGGADRGRGSGLAGLHDRVLALDGELTVASAPGEGTTVAAILPAG